MSEPGAHALVILDEIEDPMHVRIEGVRATRWSTTALHVGVKTATTIARVEAGRWTWSSRGARCTVQPGSLLLQSAGDVCRDIARDGPSVCHVITLDDALFHGVNARAYPPHLDAGDRRGAALHVLHDALGTGADQLTVEVALAEAIAALSSLPRARADGTRGVRRAQQLLRERHADVITLDTLAAHTGLDKYRLCRAFRAEVGLPPHAYLVHVRVGRAKELLRTGARPADIAAAVGFYDQAQLTHHFRRIVGTTPARYAADVSDLRRGRRRRARAR